MPIKKEGFKRERKRKQLEKSEDCYNKVMSSYEKVPSKRKLRRIDSKKKDYKVIENSIDLRFINSSLYIRPANEWVSKSFNIDKQIVDFLKWVYCNYPVPSFMFSLILKNKNHKEISLEDKNEYFNWFICIAQGKSFYKLTKDIFTKKEAHIFLTMSNNEAIKYNIWAAKCLAIDLNKKLINTLCNKLYYQNYKNNYFNEIISFFKRYENDIDCNTLSDVTDFLLSKRDARNFSLKGRTISSVIRLANEWHEELSKKQDDNKYTWKGLDIPTSTWRFPKLENDIWEIRQLTTSKQLRHEGKVMKHCVASYAYSCSNGTSTIFTMEHYNAIENKDEKCVTIEVSVSTKRIVQVRRRLNKPPTATENKIISKWAFKYGLKY